MSLFRREILVEPQIVGRVDGSAASAGQVGEYIQSVIPVGSGVSLTTATPANITSITLSPGDWDVEGNVSVSGTSVTTAAGNNWAGSINTTSATISTDGTEANEIPGVLTTTSVKQSIGISRKRISVTTTTTVYLVAQTVFSAGTMVGYGNLTARRER